MTIKMQQFIALKIQHFYNIVRCYKTSRN